VLVEENRRGTGSPRNQRRRVGGLDIRAAAFAVDILPRVSAVVAGDGTGLVGGVAESLWWWCRYRSGGRGPGDDGQPGDTAGDPRLEPGAGAARARGRAARRGRRRSRAG